MAIFRRAALPGAVSRQDRVVRVLYGSMLSSADELCSQQYVPWDPGRNVLPLLDFRIVKGASLFRGLDEEGCRLVGPWRDPPMRLENFVVEEQLLSSADVLYVDRARYFYPIHHLSDRQPAVLSSKNNPWISHPPVPASLAV